MECGAADGQGGALPSAAVDEDLDRAGAVSEVLIPEERQGFLHGARCE
jgi:hypothetical protein